MIKAPQISKPESAAAAAALTAKNLRAPPRRPNPQLVHAVLQRKANSRAPSSQPSLLEAFPFADVIRRRLGRSIPSRAVVDPAACERQGVAAFTRDGEAHFRSPTPPIKVAAHEAVHVLQQSGATRDMGLGAEGHAAAIERRIVRGEDAAQLIGNSGAAVDRTTLHYTEVPLAAQTAKKWNAAMDLRVADDGNMAVGQDGVLHSFWATASKVTSSNATLKAVGSAVRLELQSQSLAGTAPATGGARALTKVLPKNLMNKTEGEAMELWADCGMAGRDVMGAGGGAGGGDMTAKYNMPGAKGTTVAKKTVADDPEEMKKEIFKKKFGLADGTAALAHYDALSKAARDKVDRELGINRFAAPSTGQGFTMSSGGANFPGAATWNFHWGGVVMTSGSDRVTLENYAVGDATVKNTDWEFQMYGPAAKAGQTFHDQHFATEQHGQKPTTMSVAKK